jgi:hypothetical protein
MPSFLKGMEGNIVQRPLLCLQERIATFVEGGRGHRIEAQKRPDGSWTMLEWKKAVRNTFSKHNLS